MPGVKIHKYTIQKLTENNTKLTKQTIKGFDISQNLKSIQQIKGFNSFFICTVFNGNHIIL